jgi:diguanylate cyclase (GGDEF)-like protein
MGAKTVAAANHRAAITGRPVRGTTPDVHGAPDPGPESVSANASPSGEIRLLYVEDDQGHAYLVRRTLERLGFQVEVARDGQEGLALYAAGSPAALIVDQTLPHGSGLEFIRTLGELADLPPVIMLTGTGSEAVAVEAMKLGVSEYVPKDSGGIYLRTLPSMIWKAIEQRRSRTAQLLAESAAEQEHAQLLSIFECLEEAIYVSDIDTHEILFVNETMRNMVTEQTLVGALCHRVIWNKESPCAFCTNAIIRLDPGTVHRWEHHDPDRHRDFAMTDRLIRWPDGRMVRFGHAMDITERKRAEERLHHLAYHDILTGLPNRQLLRDRLQTAIALAERHGHNLGLIFVDIDNFKSVNDRHGHRAGDILLRNVAIRLRDAVRRSDTVGRLSGDEFLVLLAELSHTDDVTNIAEKIVRVMQLPFAVTGTEVAGTCSAGTVVYPRDGLTPDQLLSNADEALYQAKSAGGNRHKAYSGQPRRGMDRTDPLAESMVLALDAGQLTLHYQPLVSLRRGEIISAEALLRWRHPRRGLLSPDDFLSSAEGAGLGPRIGNWVLQSACEQGIAWGRAGLRRLRVSVNLSLLQMQAPDLSDRVRTALRTTGLAPRQLDLEVTESMAAEDIETYANQLGALRSLGVSISLDDFGTGRTSISHLHRLPITCAKIDKTLIQDSIRGPKERALISALTAFAHMLGMVVVAEGVETPEQAGLIRRCGCDVGQGFFFGHPMPAEEFEQFVADYSGPARPLGRREDSGG